MANKKNLIQSGLNGLLATPQEPVQTPVQDKVNDKVTGNYKTVCYSIPPEYIEKIKDIAYWDRKKINAVVVEAFSEYIAKWEKSQKK